MNIISNGYRFRRGTGSPFDTLPNPLFGTNSGIPCQWCHFCKMSVETRTEAYNQSTVWAKKEWCKRCGNVTASAVYYQVTVIEGAEKNTLWQRAKQWITMKEDKG